LIFTFSNWLRLHTDTLSAAPRIQSKVQLLNEKAIAFSTWIAASHG
jgi:hypothetical protein